jgi:hypothetical protein
VVCDLKPLGRGGVGGKIFFGAKGIFTSGTTVAPTASGKIQTAA